MMADPFIELLFQRLGYATFASPHTSACVGCGGASVHQQGIPRHLARTQNGRLHFDTGYGGTKDRLVPVQPRLCSRLPTPPQMMLRMLP